MALTTVLTGTGVSTTFTNGSNAFTLGAADAGILVGSTMQGTGITAGTKVLTISGTSGTMSTNFTGTSGAVSTIYSSKFGSTLTVTLTANTDSFTPQDIITNGFAILQGTRELLYVGGLKVVYIVSVAGGVFDFGNWTIEHGSGGLWQFDQTSLGEFRGGYLVNGTQFIKTAGPTFYYNQWNNGQAGGSGMFQGTSTGAVTGLFRMHNPRFIERVGSNAGASFSCGRMNCLVENMILDYQVDSAGTNAGIAVSYGTLKNTYLIKSNGSFSSPNAPTYGNLDGLIYVGNYQSSPQHKFAIPNNYTLDKYAPQVVAGQYLGGFSSNTIENYSNPDFSTAGWGLSDLITNYLRYSGWNTLNWSRFVSLTFKDSNASALSNVTLYIKGATSDVLNAVQAGDYSANTIALIQNWTAPYFVYRVNESYINNISQTAQVRKYGYFQQTTSYSLNLNTYSQPFFLLADSSVAGINEATASALSSIYIDWEGKAISVTANANYDQISARISYELALTTGSKYADPRTISGKNLSLASGWTINVMPSVVLSTGTNITYIYSDTFKIIDSANTSPLFDGGGILLSSGILQSPTILGVQTIYTGVGSVTGVYGSLAGTSTVLQLNTPSAGYSLCIFKADGTTKYFASNVTTGSYYVYFAPSEAGTYYLGAENYGQKRTADTLVLSGGNVWYNITDQEDVGITDTKVNVASYTTLTTTSQIYDATAYFRLTETGIKLGQLCTRDGLYLDFSTYNVKIKDDASAIVSVASGTITYKSIVINETTKYNAMKATPPKTITPTDTEIINVLIEDANGDSKVSILGGDNLGYELWKVTTATATDDYATGTLLTTLANNTAPYRFIGISGYDMVGRDISSGVRRRSSMLKGTYTQAFYVGNQIQLATDAPQLQENNDKLSEVILKLDTKLDVAISTRLANADYIDPATAQQIWEYTTRTLTSEGASGATLAEIEGSLILAKKAQIDALGSPMQASSYVAPDNTTIGQIKTKVDTLENYDDTALQAKIDASGSTNKADLTIINNNVKKASKFIPASQNLT